ncbi:MAG TPA: DUF1854 domain-containing protein [Tepidisphaeraceae bacterium]|jgi:hypothetical protein
MSEADFELIEDDLGALTLRRPGEEDVKDVRIRRAFPWSSPGKFVSIRNSEGKELLLIDDLTERPPELRARIERWLSSQSFVPKITRVDEIDTRFGYQQWRVQTDRGAIEFRVQEREDIRFLGNGRFSVKDADGNIYELPNVEALDPPSRKALEALV